MRAAWNGPVATVTTVDGKKHNDFAVSLLCADCVGVFGDSDTMQKKVKFAVELDIKKKRLLYHDVTKLEDYPLIIDARLK